MPTFEPYDVLAGGSTYHPEPYCMFCWERTDLALKFSFRNGPYQVTFRVPVHERCYRLQTTLVWLKSAVAFAAVLGLPTMLITAMFFAGKVSNMPLWLTALISSISILAACFAGLKASVKLEFTIRDYIDRHTDHEDYYKSDRWKWKR